MSSATDVLISLCLECGSVYKSQRAGRKLSPGTYSHGYCANCLPIVETRWFGRPQTVGTFAELRYSSRDQNPMTAEHWRESR